MGPLVRRNLALVRLLEDMDRRVWNRFWQCSRTFPLDPVAGTKFVSPDATLDALLEAIAFGPTAAPNSNACPRRKLKVCSCLCGRLGDRKLQVDCVLSVLRDCRRYTQTPPEYRRGRARDRVESS